MDVCSEMDSRLEQKSRLLMTTSELNPSSFKTIGLKELIEKLHNAFATNDVDIDYVQDLMAAYRSNPQDWKKFAKFDRYR